jgi:ElaB/YqjD/DUF883 family membrane-anchored ribosome-binding protein
MMTDKAKEVKAGSEAQPESAVKGGQKKVAEQLEKARQKFSDVAGEVEKKARAIGEGASKVGGQVKEGAEKASTVAKEKYGVAKEKVKFGYDKARKDLDTLLDDVNEYTRDNPGKAVLIAAGIGFVLGLLMRPRRD